MHLEHLNLVIRDLEETLRFYRAAFPHWEIKRQGESPFYDHKRTWIHFGDDWQYLAFSDHGVGDNRDLMSDKIGLAHFAYVTENLDALIQRLSDAGFTYAKPGASNRFRRNVYYLDPNGYEIEFVEYLSDLPNERNSDE